MLAALLAAGCASGGTSPETSLEPVDSPSVADTAAAPSPAGPGVRAGWITFRAQKKRDQLMSQTLVGESTREGKLIASGRGRMDGGKAIDDGRMTDLVDAFDHTDFARYAVMADPNTPPAGALGVVWLDRGNGFESLFLMPGAVNDPSTAGVPKTYEALKALIFTIHQRTPGSMVLTGEGWSGDDMLKQRPGGTGR